MMQARLNFGDILDTLERELPGDTHLLMHGDRYITREEFAHRTNNLARFMRDHGLETGDKIAYYMRNCPEYVEGVAAGFKARLAHVNVNYRYRDEELRYILDNSDARCVIYGAEFRECVMRIAAQLPDVKLWLEVDGDGASHPDFANCYDTCVKGGEGLPLAIERSADDEFLLYTGGTTGMPKGVIWTQDIFRESTRRSTEDAVGYYPETMDQFLAMAKGMGQYVVQLPACPVMHGTGLFTMLRALITGGAIVTLPHLGKFDAAQLWKAVTRHKVTNMAIVGDAFGKPLVEELDTNGDAYDVSSMLVILSSGVMWSVEVKRALLDHMPGATMVDSFGSSEAVGYGYSRMTKDGEVSTSQFEIGADCKVFSEDGREIMPGSDETGLIARGGATPLGYYKDPEKTAKTYRVIDGKRYTIPGDWCKVAADGTLTLLGRGSQCINSGGEKIFPEEVEEALKLHDSVRDALVVGIPDPKWGAIVVAVVTPETGTRPDAEKLRTFVGDKIARYKAPKHVLFKDDLERAPNGKADYKRIRDYTLAQLSQG